MIWLPLVGLLPCAIAFYQLQRFLREVPVLGSSEDLERFRELAARQMILALVQFAVLASPWIAFVIGLVRRTLTPADGMYSTASFIVVLAAGLLMRGAEKRAQSLAGATPELQSERDRIVYVWLHEPLPTWPRRRR
jgi:drug/metabolite transporter (DMT)-like permease